MLTVTWPERDRQKPQLARETAGYDTEVRGWLQRLVGLKRDGMAELSWEQREELRAIVSRSGLASDQRATLAFWMIIRRVRVPDPVLDALAADEFFVAQSDDRWLFTLGRISLFRAQPYSPHQDTERQLRLAQKLFGHACAENESPAFYWLYRAVVLHYLRAIELRRGDEAAADESLEALVAAVDAFIKADERRMLLPPPYLRFAGSVLGMPPEMPLGDGSNLPWAPRLPFALLIGSDLRSDLRADFAEGVSWEKLARLMRFYRQALLLEPPAEQTFDFTAAELAAFLLDDLPEAAPEFAQKVTGEAAVVAELLEELRDVVGYAEANPIYVGTNLAAYHENRRLSFRGDFRAIIDAILRKLDGIMGNTV